MAKNTKFSKRLHRANALTAAKDGFKTAIRTGQYNGHIGRFYYHMDRDNWCIDVTNIIHGYNWSFPIAKSWEV